MSTEQILFIAALVLGGVGVICLGTAIYMYFAYNIPDIRDDLSGKKRAEAIANMDEPGTGVLRRNRANARAERAQQKLAAERTTGSIDPLAPPEVVQQSPDVTTAMSMPAPAQRPARPSRPVPQAPVADDIATTVLAGDETQTTVLGASEEQTTVLGASEEQTTVLGETEPETSILGQEEEDITTVLDDDAEKTTMLGGSPVTDTASNVAPAPAPATREATPAKKVPAPARAIPSYFTVVQKVVLTGSDDFLRVEQGEGHA